MHFINIEKRIIQKFEQQYNLTESKRPVAKDEKPSPKKPSPIREPVHREVLKDSRIV